MTHYCSYKLPVDEFNFDSMMNFIIDFFKRFVLMLQKLNLKV